MKCLYQLFRTNVGVALESLHSSHEFFRMRLAPHHFTEKVTDYNFRKIPRVRDLDHATLQLFEFSEYFHFLSSPPLQLLWQTLVAVDKGRRSVTDSLLLHT